MVESQRPASVGGPSPGGGGSGPLGAAACSVPRAASCWWTLRSVQLQFCFPELAGHSSRPFCTCCRRRLQGQGQGRPCACPCGALETRGAPPSPVAPQNTMCGGTGLQPRTARAARAAAASQQPAARRARGPHESRGRRLGRLVVVRPASRLARAGEARRRVDAVHAAQADAQGQGQHHKNDEPLQELDLR